MKSRDEEGQGCLLIVLGVLVATLIYLVAT